MQTLAKTFFVLIFTFYAQSIFSQDFMMQGWYWDYPKTANGYNWADTLNDKAASLGAAGFNYVWLPPLSRASFGNNSNGYDPKDLYDLGIPSEGATGFGTRAELDAVVTAFNNNGINPVADVVYNHRDGGLPEDNPAVEGWIENLDCTKVNAGDNAFPSDRFRCYLPLGGSSGNGAGTYYFKVRSASKHPNFYNRSYKFYTETNTTGYQGLPEDNEDETGGGNGGGDCGQGNNTIQLGVDMIASIDDVGSCAGACGIDEFQLTIGASDYDASGDTLYIYMTNSGGGYSDHFISGLWDGSADIQGQIKYQTYTDFTNMPSGRGGMNYTNFKPNGNPTQLNGDWDFLWFFNDYDQSVQSTIDTLNVWSKWLWDDVGIRGFRMDAVKHFDYAYTGDLLDYLHDNGIDPGMVVGEFYDNNASLLSNWVSNVEANMDMDTKSAIDVRVFDFSMRAALKDACDAFGYDVRNVFNTGIVESTSTSSFNVVTFVNNHDFRDEGQPVQNDPMLAYAYILTNNQIGLPCVFYPDYWEADVPHTPATFLKDEIDELMSIHSDHIFQSNSVDYLSRFGTPYSNNYISGFDNTTLLYQLSGGISGKEVIVAINFAGETLRLDHGVNMANLSVGDTLRDVVGNSNFPFSIVNGSEQMYVELPPRSYSVWISYPNLGPLPVELSHFEVQAKGSHVRLDWNSYNEVDLKTYEIQRSKDGLEFESIAFEPAKGNGTYAFDDLDPFYNQTIYYRLKMIDLDGKYEYSAIKTAKLTKDIENLIINPNPFKNQTLVSFQSNRNGKARITITDTKGEQVQVYSNSIIKGTNAQNLNLSGFPNGLYYLNIEIDGEVYTERLIKAE